MDLDERVLALEIKVNNMTESFERFCDQDLIAKKEILDEIKKLNGLVSWGKGGVVALAAVGAFLIWIWEQFKSYIHIGSSGT